MELVACKACGSKELVDDKGVTVCAYCLARYVPETHSEPAKTEFEVMLTSAGRDKISVIRCVMSLTGLGLAESKKLVESAPRSVVRGVDHETALSARAKLEAAGGTATVE